MNILDGDYGFHLPVGDGFADAVDWLDDNVGAVLDLIGSILLELNELLQDGLNAVPALVMALAMAGLGWWLKGPRFAAGVLAGLVVIQLMELWDRSMDTVALIILAAAVAMLMAVPLGVLAAVSDRASSVIRPVMDFMQTMPAFVYLIPALFFFSIGVVPGIVSTIVFAMPPGVRLTELGIREVDPEVVEAGHAFGATPTAIMRRVQIPLAMPTVMAGVNQVIMLSLSMVVIAGMVGAGGLGELVFQGVTRLRLDVGFEAGLAVVIIAMILDRMTAALSQRSAVARARRLSTRQS